MNAFAEWQRLEAERIQELKEIRRACYQLITSPVSNVVNINVKLEEKRKCKHY